MAKPEARAIEEISAEIRGDGAQALYLVVGDRVLSEPAAIRIGEELAKKAGCDLEVHRRPAELASLLADLKTYSLFAAAKIVVALAQDVLAAAGAAAQLIDEALEVCPILVEEGAELTERQRRSTVRVDTSRATAFS